jgi:hypothetical protein
MSTSAPSMKRLVVVVAAALMGGCALSNPYVKVPTVNPELCAAGCTIDQAQDYSRSVRAAFRQRLGTQARVRSNSGAAEILLGAATLGLGAAGAHRDAFVGAGLAGATTYGLATWYGNPDLEKVYAAAMTALVCAESAVEPLRLLPLESSGLNTALTELDAGSSRLTASMAALDGEINAAKSFQATLVVKGGDRSYGSHQTQIAELQAAIDGVAPISALGASTLTRANATYANGVRLRHLNGVAGNQLARTVERIVAAVDDEARKAQPDPNSVFKIVADLGGLATKIVPGLDLASLLQKAMTPENADSTKRQGKDGHTARLVKTDGAIDSLQASAASVAADTRTLLSVVMRMEGLVAQTGNVDISASLAQCGIGTSSNLVLLPAALTLTAGVNSATFRVTGGKSPYSGTVIGTRPEGMSLENPFTGDRGFKLTITASTPAGDYVIAVSDASMKEVALPVKINPTTSGGTTPGTNNDAAPARTPPALTKAILSGLVNSITPQIGKSIPGNTAKITAVTTDGKATVVISTDAPDDPVPFAALKVAINKLPAGAKSIKEIIDEAGATLRVDPKP